MKDKDKNSAVTDLQYDGKRFVVAVCADGCWFTPAQARRFAQQILRRADDAERRNAR